MNATQPKPGRKSALRESSQGPAQASPGATVLAPVKVVKREAAIDVAPVREKACSACQRPFKLTPEQKFHLCPRCFQKAQSKRPAPPRKGTQVLTQITCMSCGTVEYLTLVPTDLAKALCASCHAASREHLAMEPKAREPKPRPTHPNTR